MYLILIFNYNNYINKKPDLELKSREIKTNYKNLSCLKGNFDCEK